MWNLLLWSLLIFLTSGRAFAIPASLGYAGKVSALVNQAQIQDDEFDDTDLSFVTKLAAIGDSYSAGIGAGDRLGNILQALDPESGELSSMYLLKDV